ncbi:ankyrin repeat family protein [Anaeramoeba ignava]|uniref:Ankyrin repeat family protein n=1 Tax=Anaeramoeba ignava TaxID=1746090 RepID=A0A9Q0LIX0_ANAIG|nr:ankyrin repeat family protein [Anaeramoeba ignava]
MLFANHIFFKFDFGILKIQIKVHLERDFTGEKSQVLLSAGNDIIIEEIICRISYRRKVDPTTIQLFIKFQEEGKEKKIQLQDQEKLVDVLKRDISRSSFYFYAKEKNQNLLIEEQEVKPKHKKDSNSISSSISSSSLNSFYEDMENSQDEDEDENEKNPLDSFPSEINIDELDIPLPNEILEQDWNESKFLNSANIPDPDFVIDNEKIEQDAKKLENIYTKNLENDQEFQNTNQKPKILPKKHSKDEKNHKTSENINKEHHHNQNKIESQKQKFNRMDNNSENYQQEKFTDLKRLSLANLPKNFFEILVSKNISTDSQNIYTDNIIDDFLEVNFTFLKLNNYIKLKEYESNIEDSDSEADELSDFGDFDEYYNESLNGVNDILENILMPHDDPNLSQEMELKNMEDTSEIYSMSENESEIHKSSTTTEQTQVSEDESHKLVMSEKTDTETHDHDLNEISDPNWSDISFIHHEETEIIIPIEKNEIKEEQQQKIPLVPTPPIEPPPPSDDEVEDDTPKESPQIIFTQNPNSSIPLRKSSGGPQISYDFPPKFAFKTSLVDFNEFNRNIMDFIVELNTKYLIESGYFLETNGQLAKIQKNMAILETIKSEMEYIGSNFKNHLANLTRVCENEIYLFLDFAIPFICKQNNIKQDFKGKDTKTLLEMIQKNQIKLTNDKKEEIISLLKNLISLSEFVSSANSGVIELIKQDLGVYYFDTNNELEMASGKVSESTLGVQFNLRPVNVGSLEVKIHSKRLPAYLALTASFLHIFLLDKHKPNNITEKLRTGIPDQSFPINMIRVHKHLEIQGKENFFSSKLTCGDDEIEIISNDELVIENWSRMLTIMHSRLEAHQMIRVNPVSSKYKYSYTVIIHEYVEDDGSFSFDVRSFSSMWSISKTFLEFIDLLENLKQKFSTHIFPKMSKIFDKLIKLTRTKSVQNEVIQDNIKLFTVALYYTEATLRELLGNPEVAHCSEVIHFFQIDNIFHPIAMQDVEYIKFLCVEEPKSLNSFTDNGDSLLHYLLLNYDNSDVIQMVLKSNPDLFKIPNGEEITPILLAVKLGQIEILKIFSQIEQVDLNFVHENFRGITPFLFSIENRNLKVAEFLISQKCDLNAQETQSKKSALHYAVEFQDLEIVLFLLNNSINLELRNSDNFTSLHLAIQKGCKDIVDNLLKFGADPNAQTLNGLNCLHLAANSKNSEILKLVLNTKKVDINSFDNTHKTPLLYAVETGNIQLVSLLIQQKAKLDLSDDSSFTIFHKSILMNNEEMFFYLAKQANSEEELNINSGSPSGDLLIHSAIIIRNFNILKFIIEHEGLINAQNHKEETPLHLAAYTGNFEIIKLLLEKGADPKIQDLKNQFPIFIICDCATLYGVKITKLITLLLSKGTDINCKNGELKQTCLHLAVQKKNMKLIRFFIEKGADMNIQDSNGSTCLHYAIKTDDIEIMKYLCKNGAYTEIQDRDGKSPLNYMQPKKRKQIKDLITKWQEKLLLKKTEQVKQIKMKERAEHFKIVCHEQNSLKVMSTSIFSVSKMEKFSDLKEAIKKKFKFPNDDFVLVCEDKFGNLIYFDDDSDINNIYFPNVVEIHLYFIQDAEKLFEFGFFFQK